MNRKQIIKVFYVLWLLLASAAPAQTFGQQKNWSAKQVEAANKAVTVYMKHDTRESKHLAAAAISEILGISLPEAYKYIDNRVATTLMTFARREEQAKERLTKAYLEICDTCAGYIHKLYGGSLLTQEEIEAFPRFHKMNNIASKYLGYSGTSVRSMSKADIPVMRNHTIKYGDGSGRFRNLWSPTVTLVGSTIVRNYQTNRTDTVLQFTVPDNMSCCILWYKSTGVIQAYWAKDKMLSCSVIKGDFSGFLPETVAQYSKDSLELRNNLKNHVIARVEDFFKHEKSENPWPLRFYDLRKVVKKKAKPLPSYLKPGNLYFVGKDRGYDIWTFSSGKYQMSHKGESSMEASFFSEDPISKIREMLSKINSEEDIHRIYQQCSMNETARFIFPFINNKFFFDMKDFFIDNIPSILAQSKLYESFLCYKNRDVQTTPNKPDYHGMPLSQRRELYLFLVVDKQNKQIYLVDGVKQQKVEITPSLRFLLQ